MKAPTKHGLDRKFKPWRKGKSANGNKRSSLKQQLRGYQRLLQKLQQQQQQPSSESNNNSNNNKSDGGDASSHTKRSGDIVHYKSDEERRQELQQKIKALEVEISQKQQTILEKKHSEKAHGQRFLDRQRLTRREKQVRKNLLLLEAKNNNQKKSHHHDEELLKIALDQVYVAHHPSDVKYMPLFSKGNRVTDQSRQLYRRAVTRKRILKELQGGGERVKWIADDQYDRLPKKEWTIQDEERMFGGSISRKGLKEDGNPKKQETVDSRFAIAQQHEALLQAADEMEKEIEKNEESKNSGSDDDDDVDSDDSSSSSSSSSDDEADNVGGSIGNDQKSSTLNSMAKGTPDRSKSDSSSSSSNDSDSSSSSEDEVPETKVEIPQPKHGDLEEEEEEDDFLMDANDGDAEVFKRPVIQLPALSGSGDKSKGWETQRQRPGQFKKKRTRY